MTEDRAGRTEPNFRGTDALLPTVVQDETDGRVLGVAYSNAESWGLLRRTGRLVLYSRSRRTLWVKGERSGGSFPVVGVEVDCDADAILVRVRPSGPYCHLGSRGCFEDAGPLVGGPEPNGIWSELEALIAARRGDPNAPGYTATLLRDEERRLKKVGEEATEVVVAAARRDRAAVVRESADLLYHLLVVLGDLGLSWKEVEATLAARRSTGGSTEVSTSPGGVNP